MNSADQISSSQTISPLDAVWTIVLGQSKSVQKALLERLTALYPAKTKETPQQKYVRTTLVNALSETKQTIKAGGKMPSAYSLLEEL